MTRRAPAQVALFEDAAARGGRVRRVRRGVDATVAALRATGRLEAVDAALVAMARTLADALDDEHVTPDGSAFTVATLAGRLFPIVEELRGEQVGALDDLDALLASMALEQPAPPA